MNALEKNERKRWSYMSQEQLSRRLARITNPDKMRLFILMADEYGESKLLAECRKKLRFFESNGVC